MNIAYPLLKHWEIFGWVKGSGYYVGQTFLKTSLRYMFTVLSNHWSNWRQDFIQWLGIFALYLLVGRSIANCLLKIGKPFATGYAGSNPDLTWFGFAFLLIMRHWFDELKNPFGIFAACKKRNTRKFHLATKLGSRPYFPKSEKIVLRTRTRLCEIRHLKKSAEKIIQ